MHSLAVVLLSIYAMLTGAFEAHAYDLCVANADGKNIYYNVIGPGEVEVTHAHRYWGTPDYAGTVEIPTTISAEGSTYKVTAIGERAFFNCRELTNVRMPWTLTSIGMMAFAWSDKISTLMVPSGVKEIGANAFEGCYGMSFISVSGANDDFAGKSPALFDHDMTRLLVYPAGKEGAYTVPDGTQHIADNAFGACTWLTEVTLPKGIKTIGNNAFYFCNGLHGIDIPASVESIGRNALNDCINLEAINVAEGNANYVSVDGTLLDGTRSKLIQSPGGTAGEAVMPDGLKEVGEMAFYRNHALTTVNLPEGATAIDACAFIDCGHLATVELPSTLAHVGDMAFALCPELQSVYMHAIDPGAIEMGDEVFVNSDLSQATLYVPSESQNLYIKDLQWRQFGDIRAIEDLKEQTITWEVGLDSISRGSRIALNARSSSQLPVQYVFSPSTIDRVTIDDDHVTVNRPGLITITAYQNGNQEYKAARPVKVCLSQASGIISPEADACSIKVYGGIGMITIKGADPELTAYVYDINGICLYQSQGRDIPVASGRIYIVRIADRAYKVAVR